MRKMLALCVLWLGLGLAMAAGPAAAQGLVGSYFGIGDAEGLTLTIRREGEGFAGTLGDASGTGQDFVSEDVGGGAEFVADLDGRPAFLQATAVPAGVSVAWTPIDPSGVVQAGETRILAFLRDGTVLPDLPEVFVPPPAPGAMVSGNAFLQSYEFWSPDGVVAGYEALPQKFRTVMRMFPLVQLDVIRRLCLAPGGGRAQAVALRGQGLACGEVTALFAAMQGDGRLERFRADLVAEREILSLTVLCADFYTVDRAQCDDASRLLAERAVSMETAATALRRYR